MGDFLKAIELFCDKSENRLDEFVRQVCFHLFMEVTMRTPVKTGLTRGNWYLSPQGHIYGWFDETRLSPDGTLNMMEVQDMLPSIKAGGIVRIVNHTPYVIDLEYGYSKQAPSGMARMAVVEFQPIVNWVAGRLNNA